MSTMNYPKHTVCGIKEGDRVILKNGDDLGTVRFMRTCYDGPGNGRGRSGTKRIIEFEDHGRVLNLSVDKPIEFLQMGDDDWSATWVVTL